MKQDLTVALIALAAIAGTAQADVTLDGVFGGADAYANTETVSWFNGHKTEHSIYGNFGNQTYTTQIRYGIGELAGDNSGTEYFFLTVEAPLYAKHMVWEDLDWQNNYPIGNTDPNVGLTEDDVASYRTHHETHHGQGDMKLDFGGATGSEKMVFVDGNGGGMFEADLAGDADNAFGLMGFMDSVDYLFDNNISTEALSLARDTTMSFEFQFEVDGAMNEQLLNYVRNGIEFHLSPERGQVPAPTSAAVLGLAGIAMLRRRRPGC